MNAPDQPNLPAKGQFLVYQTEDCQVKIDVRLQGETAWFSQAHMTALFQTQQADAAGGEFEKAIKQLLPPPKPKKRGKK